MSEEGRLRAVVEKWGAMLLAEGRITVNDFRSAVLGVGPVGDVRPDPLEGAWRDGYLTALEVGAHG